MGDAGGHHKEIDLGDEMPDGTIYAGISPETHERLYAMPQDETPTMTWEAAINHAAKSNAQGRRDWRAPTKDELNMLFENRSEGKLKGTFNETGSHPAGWYWSSSPGARKGAWSQLFSDGDQYYGNRSNDSSLRLVR